MFYFMCELEHTKLGKSKRRKERKKTKKEKSINERQDKSWRMTMYGFVWLKNIASLCSAVLDEISWTKLWREKRRRKKRTANGEYNALIVIVMIRVCGCRHKIYSLFAARYSAIHCWRCCWCWLVAHDCRGQATVATATHYSTLTITYRYHTIRSICDCVLRCDVSTNLICYYCFIFWLTVSRETST